MQVPAHRKVLICWVYHPAFGHVVEAIEAAASVIQANPDAEVSLVLAKAPGTNLLQYAPWVKNCWIIDPGSDPEAQIKAVPREWDHVIYPVSLFYEPEKWYSGALLTCNRLLMQHLRGTRGEQFERAGVRHGVPLEMPAFPQVRLKLPDETRAWAEQHRNGSGPVFALLLSSSIGATHAPRIGMWHRIIRRLASDHLNAQFWVVGTSHRGRFGLVSERGRRRQIERLQDLGAVRLLLDVGLERQLALMEVAHVFVSPHTGFAFLASCVGTPWLCLSGGAWPDAPLGNTPFWFSMPKCDKFPCWGREKLECRIRRRLQQPVACFDGLLSQRLEEISHAASQLVSGTVSFEQSMLNWQQRSTQLGIDSSRLYRLHEFLRQTGRTLSQ
jgi:hypothetical protein